MSSSTSETDAPSSAPNPLPRMAFGQTGHESTRIIFGAAAFGGVRQDRADATMEMLLDAGVNHIDTAASYGESELRLAPWMQTHRDRFFLATKTGDRSGDGARAELERSLERLGVDQVDLIQLHNLVEDDEWAAAHGPGGAVDAMVKARDEGLVRFIGVTGHGLRIPSMHMRSLDAFPFDSVLFPLNHVLMENPDYARDVVALIDRCTADNVAMQTIKSIARRRWPDPADRRFAWYEPLDDADAMTRAVLFVLAHQRCFLNTSSDLRHLPAVLDTARGPIAAPTPEQLEADRLAQAMTPLFDGGDLERI